jgi:Domain of unknown function (DUF4082)/Secretion system C-terminal sorting domain
MNLHFTIADCKKLSALLLITLISFSFAFAGSPVAPKAPDSAITPLHVNFVCPCRVYNTPADTPHDKSTVFNDTLTNGGIVGIELGAKFRTSQDGFINGVRFYKNPNTHGTHVGQIYSYPGGSLLASATFVESDTGWQEVSFPISVPMITGTTYVAAYWSSLGDYAADVNHYNFDRPSDPLTALGSGTDGPDGIFVYSTSPAFPSVGSGANANYWVDIVFDLTALPVELTNFTATKNGKDVSLNWGTASEQNNKGFEVQRSNNATSWTKIGFVDGAGNSNTNKSYQFTDVNPAPGKYYYRLKQIDLDGKSKLSNTVQITINNGLALELKQNHPNPFNSSTTVNIVLSKSGKVKLTMYDQKGMKVQQLIDANKEAGTYQIQVNRKGLSAGIYYYKLEAEGQSISKKMTIQ